MTRMPQYNWFKERQENPSRRLMMRREEGCGGRKGRHRMKRKCRLVNMAKAGVDMMSSGVGC